MAVLDDVVGVLANLPLSGDAKITECGLIRFQPVSDDQRRRAMALERTLQERQCRIPRM